MRCPNCQTENEPDSRFCESCGQDLSRTGTPTPLPPVTGSTPLPAKGRGLYVSAGVAALAVIAGLAWFSLSRSSSRAPAGAGAQPKVDVKTPITFGMSAALTGPAKELGRQMKLGVEAAFSAANASGGIAGRQLKLSALDDGYEPARTKDAMKELVENQKVFAIIGNVGTPTAEVAVPYVLERKILLFGPFSGAGLLRREPPDRYVFNYRASYAEETAAVVRHFVEIKKIRPDQIAVFAQQDGFGDAGFSGVGKALRKYGHDQEKILRVGFPRNTLEVEGAVDAIVKNQKKLRAVVMVAPYRPATKFIEKLREKGADLTFSNVSFVGSTAFAEELKQLGPKYSTGVIVTQVVPPIDSAATAVAKYREALEKHFPGEKPDFVSLEGYVAATIVIEGLRNLGGEPTSESLINALESIRGLDIGIGTPITFGPSEHQGSHKVWGTMLDEKANYKVIDLE